MPKPTKHIAQFFIKLDGQQLAAEYYDQLISVEVDDSLSLPDMFVITLRDRGMKALHDDVFKPGKKVQISVEPEAPEGPDDTTPAKTVLMTGEITSIEPDLNDIDRATLVVRGYDKSHRLTRIRKTQTFTQVTDSDLASQIAAGAGLSPQVTSTSVVYPYVMQANQTDLEFLIERAKRINYRVFVEDGTLHFAPPPASPPETSLEWGVHLLKFRARLSTMNQVTDVEVRGWDPGAKAAIVGTASSPSGTTHPQIGESQSGGSYAQSAHSVTGKQLIIDRPIFSASEATKLAQATLDKHASNFIEAEGQCGGNPTILAGTKVNISGVGPRFGGKYLVTRALHHYSNAGYTTRFWISGDNGTTISELLRNGAGNGSSHEASAPKPTARGVLVGVVTNNSDPDNRGRVKVKFPQLGDNVESYWCRMASVMTGPDRGIAFMPEANDEVVVAFDHGDPNFGVVLGAVWNGSDHLPKPLAELVTGSTTIRRVIKTRVGHIIIIDDTEDPGGFVIQDKTGDNYIKIATQPNTITVQAKSDILIQSTTGKITIDGNQGVFLKGNQGDVAITTDMNVTASAQQQAKVDAQTGVQLSTPAQMTMSGTAGLSLSTTAQLSMSGTAGVGITGAGGVNITGPGPISIKGIPISLG